MYTMGFNTNNKLNMTAYNAYSNKKSSNTSVENEKTHLTSSEVDLAKEYKKYLEFNELFSTQYNDMINKGESSMSNEVLAKYKGESFDNVFKTLGFTIEHTIREVGKEPQYNIPEGNVIFNIANNSVTLARGGKININDGYLYIAQNHVSVFSNTQKFVGVTEETLYSDYKDTGYDNAIDAIIKAVDTNNARFSKETTEKALKLLGQEMGLNVNKDININGVTFEVVGGCLQTKGYAEQSQVVDGRDYLNNLLQKAYEQNLIIL